MEDWRKIDIDALEKENFLTPQELVPDVSRLNVVDIQPVVVECKNRLTKGQFLQSLQLGLDNAPYISGPNIKSEYVELIFEILVSTKNNNNDVSPIIKQLSSQQHDTLVKYLYAIMSTNYGSKQGGLLLTWFEKTIGATGLGPIIRYISDRRTV